MPCLNTASTPTPAVLRRPLRHRLLAERTAFFGGPDLAPAQTSLIVHLVTVLTTLEPQCLGLYWPVRGEFNAIEGIVDAPIGNTLRLALPYVRKLPPQMEYRAWDGVAPATRDEAGIPSPIGALTQPDVVLVPCVGFTDEGFRLGYGGGYFDRWLAAHPHVTAVGVAWSQARLAATQFQPEPHDIAMTVIVTERGVV